MYSKRDRIPPNLKIYRRHVQRHVAQGALEVVPIARHGES